MSADAPVGGAPAAEPAATDDSQSADTMPVGTAAPAGTTTNGDEPGGENNSAPAAGDAAGAAADGGGVEEKDDAVAAAAEAPRNMCMGFGFNEPKKPPQKTYGLFKHAVPMRESAGDDLYTKGLRLIQKRYRTIESKEKERREETMRSTPEIDGKSKRMMKGRAAEPIWKRSSPPRQRSVSPPGAAAAAAAAVSPVAVAAPPSSIADVIQQCFNIEQAVERIGSTSPARHRYLVHEGPTQSSPPNTTPQAGGGGGAAPSPSPPTPTLTNLQCTSIDGLTYGRPGALGYEPLLPLSTSPAPNALTGYTGQPCSSSKSPPRVGKASPAAHAAPFRPGGTPSVLERMDVTATATPRRSGTSPRRVGRPVWTAERSRSRSRSRSRTGQGTLTPVASRERSGSACSAGGRARRSISPSTTSRRPWRGGGVGVKSPTQHTHDVKPSTPRRDRSRSPRSPDVDAAGLAKTLAQTQRDECDSRAGASDDDGHATPGRRARRDTGVKDPATFLQIKAPKRNDAPATGLCSSFLLQSLNKKCEQQQRTIDAQQATITELRAITDYLALLAGVDVAAVLQAKTATRSRLFAAPPPPPPASTAVTGPATPPPPPQAIWDTIVGFLPFVDVLTLRTLPCARPSADRGYCEWFRKAKRRKFKVACRAYNRLWVGWKPTARVRVLTERVEVRHAGTKKVVPNLTILQQQQQAPHTPAGGKVGSGAAPAEHHLAVDDLRKLEVRGHGYITVELVEDAGGGGGGVRGGSGKRAAAPAAVESDGGKRAAVVDVKEDEGKEEKAIKDSPNAREEASPTTPRREQWTHPAISPPSPPASPPRSDDGDRGGEGADAADDAATAAPLPAAPTGTDVLAKQRPQGTIVVEAITRRGGGGDEDGDGNAASPAYEVAAVFTHPKWYPGRGDAVVLVPADAPALPPTASPANNPMVLAMRANDAAENPWRFELAVAARGAGGACEMRYIDNLARPLATSVAFELA